MDHFKRQLARLPFMAALIVAVAGMPTDVYAYNQQGLGHAHAAPWLQRTVGDLCQAARSVIASICDALASPHTLRYALPATALALAAAGVFETSDSGVVMAITIPELLTRKKEKVDAANAIRDRVYNQQDGEWRGDDTAQFDALMTDVEGISQQIDRIARLDEAQRSLETAEQPGERRSRPQLSDAQRQSRPGQPSKEDRALAIHGWFAAGSIEGEDIITERHRAAADRCGVRLESGKLRLRLSPVALDHSVIDARGGIDMRAVEQRLTQVDVVSPDGETRSRDRRAIRRGPTPRVMRLDVSHRSASATATVSRSNVSAATLPECKRCDCRGSVSFVQPPPQWECSGCSASWPADGDAPLGPVRTPRTEARAPSPAGYFDGRTFHVGDVADY